MPEGLQRNRNAFAEQATRVVGTEEDGQHCIDITQQIPPSL